MKLALPLIFNIMADHIVKWQAAKERESRTGFCWAKTWGVAFLFTVPGLSSFGVRRVTPVHVRSISQEWLFHCPFHHQCSSSPACCHHSAQTLLLGSCEAFLPLVLNWVWGFSSYCVITWMEAICCDLGVRVSSHEGKQKHLLQGSLRCRRNT